MRDTILKNLLSCLNQVDCPVGCRYRQMNKVMAIAAITIDDNHEGDRPIDCIIRSCILHCDPARIIDSPADQLDEYDTEIKMIKHELLISPVSCIGDKILGIFKEMFGTAFDPEDVLDFTFVLLKELAMTKDYGLKIIQECLAKTQIPVTDKLAESNN